VYLLVCDVIEYAMSSILHAEPGPTQCGDLPRAGA